MAAINESINLWHRNIILTLFMLYTSLFITYPVSVSAESNGAVSVRQNDAWIDFPLAVDVHLSARTSSPIQTLTLEYGREALTCGDVTNVVTFQLASVTEIDQRWRWEITEAGPTPPGSTLWWRWRLTTEDGEDLVVRRKTITFEDDWFVWQTLQSGNLSVHWYRGPHTLAQQMLETAEETLSRLAQETDLRLQAPIDIYLYEDPTDLRRSLPGAPDWIGGVAFPEHNVVLVVADEAHAEYGRRTVSHELGHLVVERLSFNCLTDLPVWLNEGLAMVAEGEEDPHARETLETAVAENRLLTLRQIESAFSAHAERASLSYVESYSVVRFLIDAYGTEKINALLSAFQEGVSTDEALQTTYGFDTDQLEAAWRTSLGASSVSTTSQASLATPIPTAALAAANPAPTSTAQPSSTATPCPTPTIGLEQLQPAPPSNQQSRNLWLAGSGILTLILVVLFSYHQRT